MTKNKNYKEPEYDEYISGSSTISLEGCRFFARHGVMEQETKAGNEFELSLEAMVDDVIDHPAVYLENISDDIAKTVSYADLYEICREEMQIPRRLLESVAKRIALRSLEKFHMIDSIKVTISKITPPISGITGSASVTFKAVRYNDLPF